jgi:hypothetical protein
MDRDQLIQLRQEADAEEELRRSIHAPNEQLHQREDPIGLQHVVSVLSLSAEDGDDLDAELDDLAEVLDVLPVANLNTLANVDERRDELELPEEHEVSLVLDLQKFVDFFEVLLQGIVVSNRRIDLLLQVEASDLQRLLVQ